MTVQYSTVQYSTVQYSTVQYRTVQYSTVQYRTVQYSTVQLQLQYSACGVYLHTVIIVVHKSVCVFRVRRMRPCAPKPLILRSSIAWTKVHVPESVNQCISESVYQCVRASVCECISVSVCECISV
jgi:hypothetical protein